MTRHIYKVASLEHFIGAKEPEYLANHPGDGTKTSLHYVDIPSRFKPQETPNGDLIVCCSGTNYMLDEVLGTAKDGGPALIWKDPKYGYLHTVRLEEVH